MSKKYLKNPPSSYLYLYIIILILLSFYKPVLNQINCYERCLTCHHDGNSDNHNCESCRYDYHFLPGVESTCYSREEVKTIGTGKYYVNTATNNFDECHIRCSTCLDGNTPTDSTNQCNICINGLYKIKFKNLIISNLSCVL